MTTPETQVPPEERQIARHVWLDSPLEGATPPISCDLSIDTPAYSLSDSTLPILTFSITSHFMHPITIYIKSGILDDRGSWHDATADEMLTVTDDITGQRVLLPTEIRCGSREIRRQFGHPDERYFVTLFPETPVTKSHNLSEVARWKLRKPDEPVTRLFRRGKPESGIRRNYCEPGRSYRVGLAYKKTIYIPRTPGVSPFLTGFRPGPYQVRLWWRYGTREDVLEPPEAPQAVTARGWTERMIEIGSIPDVEVAIRD